MPVTFRLDVDSNDYETIAKIYQALAGEHGVTLKLEPAASQAAASEATPPMKKLGRRKQAKADANAKAKAMPQKAPANEPQPVQALPVTATTATPAEAPPELPAESFPPISKNAVRAVLRVVAQTDAETLTGAQRWLLIDFATENGQAVDGDTDDEALLDCARSLVGWPVGP